MLNKINILCGTTASGKTRLAVRLAKSLNGVIINCDSMQVYSELPILTAQPQLSEKQGIEHRLYSCISCFEAFDVGKWLKLAEAEINNVLSIGKTPILVGGTGLYVKSLVDGISALPAISEKTKSLMDTLNKEHNTAELYQILIELDPLVKYKIKAGDTQRILRALSIFKETGKSIIELQNAAPKTQFFSRDNFHLMCISKDRAEIYNNINQRFINMVDCGAIEEVKIIYGLKSKIALPKAHGLPEIMAYLDGTMRLDEVISVAQQNTRNYAKRQTTWFKNQLKFDHIIEL